MECELQDEIILNLLKKNHLAHYFPPHECPRVGTLCGLRLEIWLQLTGPNESTGQCSYLSVSQWTGARVFVSVQ